LIGATFAGRHEENIEPFSAKLRDEADLGALSDDLTYRSLLPRRK
jgi:hypothetical protein